MAGVKGRSGGKRVGSGRKPAKTPIAKTGDPLKFLMAVVDDPNAPLAQRIKAAGLVAPYVHKKLGQGGKKAAQEADGAAVSATGRLAGIAPPKIVVNNR